MLYCYITVLLYYCITILLYWYIAYYYITVSKFYFSVRDGVGVLLKNACVSTNFLILEGRGCEGGFRREVGFFDMISPVVW